MLQGSFNRLDQLIGEHVSSGKLAGAMACVADRTGIRHLVIDGVKDRNQGSCSPVTRSSAYSP